ncbi:hypothetical protein [Microbacterium rhizomatis]|uniref:DUF3828 domain-containing protein n=1 Tax=Microbacterium rhizomatis TaxID=1631477 RepID=A0A5J5J4A1_9MICO|nr:hypothetical protein [Microbacterium rhizomatis]KAA9110891.1 hypothetical protein F6B43_04465 [Microbacterium rhizomatis]
MKSPIPFIAVALLAVMISGCSGQPSPEAFTPTPAFASEEEAFAAAEQTYRNYVDALNKVDLSDPHTFEEVYDWTTGDAYATARETFSQMSADRWTVSGESVASVVVPLSTEGGWMAHTAFAVCLDVSRVEVVDKSGQSKVSANRGAVQSMKVSLTSSSDSPTRWLVSTIEGRDGDPVCDS